MSRRSVGAWVNGVLLAWTAIAFAACSSSSTGWVYLGFNTRSDISTGAPETLEPRDPKILRYKLLFLSQKGGAPIRIEALFRRFDIAASDCYVFPNKSIACNYAMIFALAGDRRPKKDAFALRLNQWPYDAPLDEDADFWRRRDREKCDLPNLGNCEKSWFDEDPGSTHPPPPSWGVRGTICGTRIIGLELTGLHDVERIADDDFVQAGITLKSGLRISFYVDGKTWRSALPDLCSAINDLESSIDTPNVYFKRRNE